MAAGLVGSRKVLMLPAHAAHSARAGSRRFVPDVEAILHGTGRAGSELAVPAVALRDLIVDKPVGRRVGST